MNVPFVDLKRQLDSLMPEIQAAINRVIDRCAFINGSEVKDFENKMAQWQEIPEVCCVSNCTQALYLTLKGLGSAGETRSSRFPTPPFPPVKP